MSNRPTRILALAAALSTTTLAVAALTGFGSAAPSRSHAAPAEDARAVLLPTVVVRPEPQIPLLGEVTVRPSRAERIAAGLTVDAQEEGLLDRATGSSSGSHALLRGGGGLAMPYYSFGKPLPRANEE